MSGDIPNWIPIEVIEQPNSDVALEFWNELAAGSSVVPGDTTEEIAGNLRLLEELGQQYTQQS